MLEDTSSANAGCHQNMYKNTDSKTKVTSDMAVKAWYEQKIYFDYDTGKPKPGKEKEAFEFINVVNKDTKKVGFGIKDPYVVGWYCPKANTDPAVLKKNVSKERVAPVAPPKPVEPPKPKAPTEPAKPAILLKPPPPPIEEPKETNSGVAPRPTIAASDKYNSAYNEIAV